MRMRWHHISCDFSSQCEWLQRQRGNPVPQKGAEVEGWGFQFKFKNVLIWLVIWEPKKAQMRNWENIADLDLICNTLHLFFAKRQII